MKTSKLFIRFLKEKNVWSKFMRAYISLPLQHNKDHLSYIPKPIIFDYLSQTSPMSYLSLAFPWEMTSDGFKFWWCLNFDWLQLHEKIRYEKRRI